MNTRLYISIFTTFFTLCFLFTLVYGIMIKDNNYNNNYNNYNKINILIITIFICIISLLVFNIYILTKPITKPVKLMV